jgi:glycosyltransferase involved in cell wall biosynthesis
MSKKPLVSIIVPIYNMQEYLEQCLVSLQRQTYTNIEIILINDGSTDNSNLICEQFYKLDDRFQYYYQKNGGLSNARNNGIKKMNGEYAFFVDSDDWLELDTIEILLENAINSNTKVVQFTLKKYNSSSNNAEILDYNQSANYLLSINEFYAWNKIIHKDVLKDIWFVEKQVFEDLLFTFKIIKKANKVLFLRKGAFYNYRVTPNSISRQSYSIKHLDEILAYEQTISFVEENKFNNNVAQDFKNRLAFLYVNNFINLSNKYSYLDNKYYFRNEIKNKLKQLNYSRSLSNAKIITLLPLKISCFYFKFRYRIGF